MLILNLYLALRTKKKSVVFSFVIWRINSNREFDF